MRTLVAAGAALALAVTSVIAEGGCSGNSQEINGNWYCSPVTKLKYDIFGQSGSYMEVTNMDPETGECAQQPKEYSGPMAPFNEEVSIHLRGPLKIPQVAVYVKKPSSHAKRSTSVAHQRRHSHQQFHQHGKHARGVQKRAVEKRGGIGDIVTATINGEVVSWTNTYSGEPVTQPAPEAPTTAAAASAEPTPASSDSSEPAAPEPSHSDDDEGDSNEHSAEDSTGDSTGDWERVGYYDAASQTLDGMVFLNNKGGQGSGCFDYKFGNSLSYASSNGQNGAPSPQILDADLTLPSNTEVSLFSDKPCTDGDCGFVRPGTVAYHGFDGAQKAFFFEFQMPHDSGSYGGFNADMSAIWLLNAKIPRTGQYAKAECSCWKSGCGEFDVFEVLDAGNTRCKSTVHAKPALGYSDYFERPVDKTIKAALVFMGEENVAHIEILDDSTVFSPTISHDKIKEFCS